VPLGIRSYPHLTSLILQRNLLTELPDDIFRSLSLLTTLDVSYNDLQSLPPSIGNVLCYIFCNLLSDFFFVKLSFLQSLSLQYNPNLTMLPLEMGMCYRLSKLNLEGCPMSNPPPEVVSLASYGNY